MKFAVGDRVRIIATGCENNGHGPHYGELGTIKATYKDNRIPYVVIRDHSPKETGICYDELISGRAWTHQDDSSRHDAGGNRNGGYGAGRS